MLRQGRYHTIGHAVTHNFLLNPRPLFFFEQKGEGKGNGFVIKKQPRTDAEPISAPMELPIPDQDYIKYHGSTDRYIETGKRDADLLREALLRAGVDNETGPGNFLEFGCANARVLRWFADWAQHGEAWGVDLNAAMILWCHEHLSPPFHFSVSTTIPKLPFEDRFFSAVLATSVFTHIDDLYLSWFCEVRRILKPGGLFYFTFHDEVTAQIQEKFEHGPYKRRIKSQAYNEFLEQDSDYCSTHRDWKSLTSFRRDYLIDHLENYFELVEVVERALALSQTALLMRRK